MIVAPLAARVRRDYRKRSAPFDGSDPVADPDAVRNLARDKARLPIDAGSRQGRGMTENRSSPTRSAAPPAHARALLRARTADAHERVDASFSGFDLGDRTGYSAFLQAQAMAYLPVEAALDRSGAGDLLADWPARRRAHLLEADLAALATPLPPLLAAPALEALPRLLGALYVIEGSRLGGAMLKRLVAPELPTSFLSHPLPGGWRKLLELVDERLAQPEAAAGAIQAARETFSLFERAASLCKERPAS
jgi:heme oxygenase